MKSLITAMLIILLSFPALAQEYLFEKGQSSYSSIVESGNKLTPDTSWTSLNSFVNIPDTFFILEDGYSSIYLEAHGAITFYGKCGISNWPAGPTLLAPFMFVEDRSIYDSNSDSAISGIYVDTIMVEGETTLIIEWYNVTLSGGSGYYDSLNYQVHLNQYDNSIAIHFGQSQVEDPPISYTPGPGPIFAWNYDVHCSSTSKFKSLLLFGDEQSPEDTVLMDQRITELEPHWLETIPDSGVVFKFYPNPKPTGIENKGFPKEAKLFPNPVHDVLNISIATSGNYSIKLYDIQGKILISKEFRNSIRLDVSEIPSGVYLYRLKDEKGRITNGKVVKN